MEPKRFESVCAIKGPATVGRRKLPFTASSDEQVVFPPFPPAPPDVFLGNLFTSNTLFPDQCETLSMPASVRSLLPGPYFLVSGVDISNSVVELREDNNVTASGPVGLGAGPDLTVRRLSVPANVDGAFEAEVEVCNESVADISNATNVALYVSVDTVIESMPAMPLNQDVQVGIAQVPTLNAGQCEVVAIQASTPGLPDGGYFVGAVVDDQNSVFELVESNNVSVEGPVGFGVGADLVVKTIDAPLNADTPVRCHGYRLQSGDGFKQPGRGGPIRLGRHRDRYFPRSRSGKTNS